MRAHRLVTMLEGILLVLLVTAHVILLQFSRSSADVHDAAIFAQAVLWVAWLCLGPLRGLHRVAAATAAAIVWIGLLSTVLTGSATANVGWKLEFLALECGTLLMGLMVLRPRGLSVRPIGPVGPVATPFRYTLWHLILLTLAVAVAVRLGQYLGAEADGEFSPPSWLVLPSVGLPLGGVALLAVWAMLKPGQPVWRLPALALLTPAAGLLAPWLCARSTDALLLVPFAGYQIVIVTLSLFVVRHAGYRLCRESEVEVIPIGNARRFTPRTLLS